MVIVSAIQQSDIIVVFILLLCYHIIQIVRTRPHVNMHANDRKTASSVLFTWQTQQGSASFWKSDSAEYFFCFKCFIMVSSFNPVLTFPMRSSRANNSYYIHKCCVIRDPHKIEEYYTFSLTHACNVETSFFYLVRHVINIKPHIPVSIMHISNGRKHWMVKNHNILSQNQNTSVKTRS